MKIFQWVLLFVVICLIVGSFYWFQFRPSVIKKNCAEAVKRGGIPDLRKDYGWAENKSGYYQNCTHLNGL